MEAGRDFDHEKDRQKTQKKVEIKGGGEGHNHVTGVLQARTHSIQLRKG